MLTLIQRVAKLEKQVKVLASSAPGKELGSIYNSIVDVEHEYALRRIVELAEVLAKTHLSSIDASSETANEVLALVAAINAAEAEKK